MKTTDLVWTVTKTWSGDLKTDAVQVWRISVVQPQDVIEEWLHAIPTEEQSVCLRYRQPVDRSRAIAGRWWRRRLLSQVLGREPNELGFSQTEAGKPHVASPETGHSLQFNVSHSGDWVLLALNRVGPVGVDVERHRALDYHELAKSCFSAEELSTWSRLATRDQATVFYGIWTRKEAYLKALGMGLGKSLQEFSVHPTAEQGPLPIRDDCPCGEKRWTLWPLPMDSSHSAALVVAGEIRTIQLWQPAPPPSS